MFDIQPSIFDLPTYLRKKPLVTGGPPEQSQPRQPVKIPHRPLAQAYSSQTTDTTPLIFRALAHPSQRRPAAAAAASSSTFPAPQSQTRPASAPAPSQPPQTPPTARTATQSTEEEDPTLATAPKEAADHVEPESSLRDQSPIAGPSPQPSSKPTDPTPQSPSQPPSTASPAPQSTEEEAPKVTAAPKEAAEPQSPTTPAPASPQSPSQPPTTPAPSQPPAPPPQTSEEKDPKAVDAVNKAAAQVEAETALRKERQPRRTQLESAGQRGTATSLEALEDEIRTRHAELVKKFPQRGPEYEAGMKALLQHIQQQEAQIKAKAQQLPEIAARIYQQWGKGVAGNWITEQALREKDRDSPGAPLSRSHLDALDQEAAKYGVDPQDLRHHLEMLRISDWSRGDTSAPVRHGPGGSIWVNPDRFLDENAYRQAVEKAWGSEAEKAAAMDRFPEMQQRAAKAQLGVLRTLGVYNQWEAAQPEGMSDAQKLAQFQKEHSGIFSTGAWKVRMHQALLGVASGVIGLAKSAVGAYEAATGSQGAMDLYRKLSNDAASISASSSALPTGQWVHMGTSMVVGSAPSLGVGGLASLTLKAGGAAFGLRTAAQVAQAAQTWGLRGAAATGGLQTFGSMYGDAVQGYMSRGDSEATALNKAFIPALAGAASTYLLTVAGGAQGMEAMLRQSAFKPDFRQWFKAVIAGSVKEGLLEEAPDQLIQGILERYHHHPNKSWKEIIEETLQAGIGGALLGGAVEATTTGITPSGTNQDQPQPSIPSNTTPVTPDGSDSDQSSTTNNPPPAAVDLPEVGKALGNIQRLTDKAKDGPLSLEEQRELDHNEKVLAQTRIKNLEKEQQVIRNLPQPRELDPVKAKALEEARAVVQRPVPGEPPAQTPKTSIPDTTTQKPEGRPLPGTDPSQQNSAGGPRLQFSQGSSEKKNAGQAMQGIASDEGRFRRGKASQSKDFGEIAKEYALPGELSEVDGGTVDGDKHVKKTFRIDLASGGHAYISQGHDGKVWVDTRNVRGYGADYLGTKGQPVQGGDLVYQAAMTYAHNNGLQFVGDPSGVSVEAHFRRVSQMLSNALRHGTTEHLVPYQQENGDSRPADLPDWHPQKGPEDAAAYQHNINQLALAEMHEVEDIMRRRANFADFIRADAAKRGQPLPEPDPLENVRLGDLKWDPKDDTVTHVPTGRRLSERDFKQIVSSLDPGGSGIGATTLSRALVARQAFLGDDVGGDSVPNLDTEEPGGRGRGEADVHGSKLFRILEADKQLFYSHPGASENSGSDEGSGGSGRKLASHFGTDSRGLAQQTAQTVGTLNERVPGLLNDRTHVFHSTEDLLNSDYAKQHPFSKEDLAGLQNAEGFHDPKTGHSVVIAGNVELRPGETPHDALTRVILHERVGHDGLQTLLGSKDSKAQQHWQGLTQRIPQAELDAIASQQGYQHLKDNPAALAHEWFARQAEKSPELLKKPGLLRDMWEAFKAQLRKMSNSWKNTDESHLDTHLQELLRHSRKAALQTPSASQPRSPRT